MHDEEILIAVPAARLRVRELDTSLGRWTRQDPLGFADGPNVFQSHQSSPSGLLDPLGLQVIFGNPPNQDPAYKVKGDTEENREKTRQDWERAKTRNAISWLILTLLELHPGTVYVATHDARDADETREVGKRTDPSDGDPSDPSNPVRTVRINHNPNLTKPDAIEGNPPADPESTLVHEAVHALLMLLGRHPKGTAWVEEVIPTYIENIHRDSKGLDQVKYYEGPIPPVSGWVKLLY